MIFINELFYPKEIKKMTTEYELFKGKTLSGLFEDIYNNSSRNKKQLEVLVKEVVGFIKDGDTAIELIPMIKEYLEINVKNDELLVKLAGVVQRILATEGKVGSESEFGLTEEEKNQIMKNIDEVVENLQNKTDDVTTDIKTITKLN
jgi:predicted ATP-grasp superfamily ATP-dependent carboligase|tara:strand:+ start:655 stop:1095 length:441 start_codon:yes stop_codon:yes gene_type:complete